MKVCVYHTDALTFEYETRAQTDQADFFLWRTDYNYFSKLIRESEKWIGKKKKLKKSVFINLNKEEVFISISNAFNLFNLPVTTEINAIR